jgi:6-phosphogluconolactonase
MKPIRLLLLTVLGISFLVAPLKAQFVYVLAADTTGIDRIWAYSMDSTGALTTLSTSPYAAGFSLSGSLAIDPKGKYLYAVDPDDGLVWGYTIDATGTLTQFPGPPISTLGVEPYPVTVDPTGKFLYVVNSDQSIDLGSGPPSIAAYTIGPRGKLIPMPGSPFPCGNAYGQPVIDQTARFMYLIDASDKNIAGFRIEGNGAITPLAGAPFGAGLEPLALQSDPRGKFLYEFAYVPSTAANVIAVYQVNDDGVLVPIRGSPFSYAPGLFPIALSVDSVAELLYLANFDTANISAYKIQAQGLLQQIQGSPFTIPGRPTTVSIEPIRGFLYVGDFYGNSIFGYKVGKNGTLTAVPNSPFTTGLYCSAIAIKSP